MTAARVPEPTQASDDELIRAHLPLVGHIVREVLGRLPSHVSRDDLMSAGMYAVAVSAAAFDPSRGVPFARFAAIRIRGAITDELRTMDWASRAVRSKAREIDAVRTDLRRQLGHAPSTGEVAQTMGVEPSEVISTDADVQRANVLSLQAITADGNTEVLPTVGESPEGLLVRREQIGYLRDAVAALPDRLRTVITEYFLEQRKMGDIAVDLGVSESRVSQMRAEALALLHVGFEAIDDQVAPATKPHRGRASTTLTYTNAVVTSSTLAGRLSATTLLGETRLGAKHLVVSAT